MVIFHCYVSLRGGMSNWQPSCFYRLLPLRSEDFCREMQPLKAEIWSVFEFNAPCFVCDEWMTYIQVQYNCLVLWNIFFTSWECHNPNWRIHIFQRGWLKPPTRRRSVWLMFYSVKEVTEPPLKLGICWFWGTPKLNQREANTKRGRRFLIRSWDCCLISIPIGSMCAIYGNIYHQYTPNVSIYTRKHPDSPTPLYTWGYQTLDFTFNWEDQQGYLGNINFPPPLNFYIHWRSSIRV